MRLKTIAHWLPSWKIKLRRKSGINSRGHRARDEAVHWIKHNKIDAWIEKRSVCSMSFRCLLPCLPLAQAHSLVATVSCVIYGSIGEDLRNYHEKMTYSSMRKRSSVKCREKKLTLSRCDFLVASLDFEIVLPRGHGIFEYKEAGWLLPLS